MSTNNKGFWRRTNGFRMSLICPIWKPILPLFITKYTDPRPIKHKLLTVLAHFKPTDGTQNSSVEYKSKLSTTTTAHFILIVTCTEDTFHTNLLDLFLQQAGIEIHFTLLLLHQTTKCQPGPI